METYKVYQRSFRSGRQKFFGTYSAESAESALIMASWDYVIRENKKPLSLRESGLLRISFPYGYADLSLTHDGYGQFEVGDVTEFDIRLHGQGEPRNSLPA